MQDGRFVRYCSGSTEHPVVQQYVADYAEKILQSVQTTDLLFQTSNEAAAAWCYRVPEQLVRCVCVSSMRIYDYWLNATASLCDQICSL